MVRMTRSNALRIGCALGFLAATMLPAAHATVSSTDRAVAQAFVQDLSSGRFAQAEARFRPQMRRLATPDKLRSLWQFVVKKFGAYKKIDRSDAVNVQGHRAIIVHTVFERLTIGFEITFDSSHQIAGIHVVPVG